MKTAPTAHAQLSRKVTVLSFEDPFDEAPLDGDSQPASPPAKKAAVKKAPAAPEVSDGKITLTFKGAGGYGDRWVVAHVTNPAEGLDLLNDPQFKELLDLSRKVASYDGKDGAAPAAAPAAPRGGTPQVAQQAPNGESRHCEHGEMVFKSGVSKAGKAYRLFSCTAPREQQCKAQFLN